MYEDSAMIRNQGGGSFVLFLLFLINAAFGITAVLDYFRFNSQVQQNVRKSTGRMLLREDLVHLASIRASVRMSLLDSRNRSLRECLLFHGSCPKTPTEFIFSSPIQGNRFFAGTESLPAYYSESGESCEISTPECDLVALSFFKTQADEIEIWVELGRISEKSSIKRRLKSVPSVQLKISDIMSIK